jgi:hypothetical protein
MMLFERARTLSPIKDLPGALVNDFPYRPPLRLAPHRCHAVLKPLKHHRSDRENR